MVKCCQYNAGQLRTPCQFQRKTRVSDGAGGWSEAWTHIAGAATRCSFKMLSGSERWQAMRTEATTRNRIVVRYFSDLTEADRVVIAGRRYNITAIDNVELRNRWMVIEIDGGVAS